MRLPELSDQPMLPFLSQFDPPQRPEGRVLVAKKSDRAVKPQRCLTTTHA